MSLEATIATENSKFFTREFTFSAAPFRNDAGQEVELCDGAIWLDELLILFQLKERNLQHASRESQKEQIWFKKQIEQKAVGQFVATLRYLREESSLPLTNRRGQKLDVAKAHPTAIHLVALYAPSNALPNEAIHKKGRVSLRLGKFVHFFHLGDYHAMCETLFTPSEIAEYLSFRAEFVTRNPRSHSFSEKALVGKFLTDTDDSDEIRDEYELMVDRLVDDRNEFNVSGLLHEFPDRIADGDVGTMYHAVLKEIAKLPRSLLREFRKRLEWAMSRCRDEKQPKPSRIFVPNQDCCFIAIPLPMGIQDKWKSQLEYYSHLCKYDFHAQRCVGFTVAVDNNHADSYVFRWLYLNYSWRRSKQLELELNDGNPFRKTSGALLGKYEIR